MSARLATLTCALLVSFAISARAIADDPQPEPPPLPPPLTMEGIATRPLGAVLSGGVSLGSYEAGFLHGVLMPLRAAGGLPRVLVGTSAGGINAFVGALDACSTKSTRPTDSLLYKVWIPIGLEQLFVAKEVSAVSALSRSAFKPIVERLRRVYDAGLDERCDVRVGFALTRERPRMLPLGPKGAQIARMTEHVLVRLRGRGLGHPPLVENAGTEEIGKRQMYLALDGPDAKPFDALMSAIMASSGLPLAFPPQQIAHCDVEVSSNGHVPSCTPKAAKPGLFVDGGFFDNRPIGLALSALGDIGGDQQALLGFIDPDLHTWPTPVDPSARRERKNALSVVVGTFTDFVEAARSAELERVLDHDSRALHALRLGEVLYPPASEPLGAFLGFIDKELRRFDFYLGLYHARHFRADVLGIPSRSLPDEGDPIDVAWQPLFCLRAIFDHDGDPNLYCSGEDLSDFRILARLAVERVADDCRRAGEAGQQSPHPVCVAVAQHRPLPAVPWVDSDEAPRRGEKLPRDGRWTGESVADYALRRLAELGFRFHDLGLNPSKAARAPLVLRARLGEIADALAKQQGTLASYLYRILAEVGLNLITYEPPRHLFGFLLSNRLEFDWSYTEPTSVMRWLRLDLALGIWGLDSLFSNARNYFAIAPNAGIRIEPLPWSRSFLQPRLGFRAGYLFSTTDRFLAGSCNVHLSTPCSRPLAEGDISVALFSVLRLPATQRDLAAGDTPR